MVDVWALGLVLLVGAGLLLIPLAVGWRVLARRRALLARVLPASGHLERLEIGPAMSRESYRVPFQYRIVTRYRYNVDGVDLTGSRFNLDLSPWWNTKADARKAIGQLSAGQGVTVWYDPDAPTTAVLSKTLPRELSTFRIATLIAGALAGAGAILMLAWR